MVGSGRQDPRKPQVTPSGWKLWQLLPLEVQVSGLTRMLCVPLLSLCQAGCMTVATSLWPTPLAWAQQAPCPFPGRKLLLLQHVHGPHQCKPVNYGPSAARRFRPHTPP